MGEPESMGVFLVGEIVRLLGQALIGSLIAALFLRWASHLVVKDSPSYGTAYLCSFVTVLINGVLGLGVGLIMGYMGASDGAIVGVSYAMIPVALLIAAAVVGKYIGVPYGKAVLIVLLQFVLTIVVFILPLILLVALLT